ncbi:unnamed protein product [Adineta steineri]|uniref:Reverse transcriptase n=1 Tax=Adineta steineri TaxID=433720 RepID=A0A819YDK4_9BILA|nr:unnamed protein product [Adineta steineri]CAF4151526.1 unnamed protein product [Adineta steineri]
MAPDQLTDDKIKYVDLIKKLDLHYDATRNIMTATYEFYSCHQKPGQPFSEWKAELCNKLRHCGFNSSKLKDRPQDRALRDAYVIGINNPKIRQALLKEEDPDLAAAEKIIQVAERLEQDVRQFNSSNNTNLPTVAKLQQKKLTSKYSSSNGKSFSTATTSDSCQSCGSTTHSRSECKYRTFACNFCKRTGHLERVCQKKKNGNNTSKRNPTTHQLKCVKWNKSKSTQLSMSLRINGRDFTFDVDTGSDHTIISSDDWKQLGSPTIRPTSLKLECYSGQQLDIQGECDVQIHYQKQNFNLTMVVIKRTGTPLLGLRWISAMKIDLNILLYGTNNTSQQVNKVYSQGKLNEILDKHKQVFSKDLGHCTKVKAHIQLVPNAVPKFFKPRPLPFAYLDGVKEEIQRNITNGILEKIDTSQWAAPIVPVRKPSGKIRICGDFKVTINSQMLVDQHPIPSIDELLTRLNNGEKFTKLDLTDAYLQVELDDSSKELVVINTPLGLFKYNRMPFGISNAPAVFQRTIDQVLAGVSNSIAYLDDILITGKDEEEHLATLELVLTKLADFGLRCNMEKCSFFQDEVVYLGYVINSNGKQPDPTRVIAIQDLPAPTDVKQVEAFIGKINYYGKFIANFSHHCAPLNRLRQNNVKWNWDSSCQKSFDTLKKQLAETTMLVHFDQQLPLILATDASSYGIGAVLMHRYADGTEKPIAHASKTLNSAERNYSQIEKEALSIVYGVKKFHQYLAAKSFELVTDHRPLLSIFNPAKGISVTTANRLARWSIALMGYNYKIRYKPTQQHGNADGLSRLPAGEDKSFVDDESIQVNRIQAQVVEEGPVDSREIQAAVDADQHLQLIKKFILNQWPNSITRKNNPDLFPYFTLRQSLSVAHGCILKDTQVVIPKSLQLRVIKMIHRGHLGVVKMKQLARVHCWWPKMEMDIENIAKSCKTCAATAPKPKEDFKPWPEPDHNWSRVHMDFLGPLWNSKWLVMVDAKSKFPFVADMGNDTSAKNLCNVLEQAIDWLGPPTTLVSDNGPPFTSFEMNEFYKKYGIQNITTAPYHPPSNGIAERFVRSFKEGMIKEQESGQTNKSIALRNVLRTYRWTPHTTTGIPPAEALFQRPIRTDLARLHPNLTTSKPIQTSKYDVRQDIWMMNHQRNKKFEWKSGVIKKKIGSMMYQIELENGQTCVRHQNQLRLRQESNNQSIDLDALPDDLLNRNKPTTSDQQQASQQSPRYPRRQRQPPDRFTPS